MAALSVPLATLPLQQQAEGEVKAVLLSYLEANSASFPCYLGEDMTEETRTVMLLYLVRTGLNLVLFRFLLGLVLSSISSCQDCSKSQPLYLVDSVEDPYRFDTDPDSESNPTFDTDPDPGK